MPPFIEGVSIHCSRKIRSKETPGSLSCVPDGPLAIYLIGHGTSTSDARAHRISAYIPKANVTDISNLLN
jgi:hypothetical protein